MNQKSKDFYSIVAKELRTSIVQEHLPKLSKNGLENSLEEIMKNLKSQTIPEVKNFVRCLLLLGLEAEPAQGQNFMKYYTEAESTLNIFPEHKNYIIETLDFILYKEILHCSNSNILALAKLASSLGDSANFISQQEAKIKLNQMIWKTIKNLTKSYSESRSLRLISTIIEAENSNYDMSAIKEIAVRLVLDYIEKRNGIVMIEDKVKHNIQNDHKLLNHMMMMNINESEIQERIIYLKHEVENIENERYESDKPVYKDNGVFEAYKILENVQLRCIEEEVKFVNDIPKYAKITKNFHVCIYKAEYKKGAVAAKIYNKITPDVDMTVVYNECKIYQILGDKANPLINSFLKYYGSFTQGDKICLVMEYIENDLMTCLTFLKQQGIIFSDLQILPLMQKLLASFAEMEELGIYHGDIKPHNILVDDNWNFKIIDFSISAVNNEFLNEETTSGFYPLQGTAGYMAPEIIEGIKKGLKNDVFKMSRADVFSLGMTFLQMLTLEDYNGYNLRENNELLMNKVDQLIYPWARGMLKKMLCADPNCRLKFKDLLCMIIDIYQKTFTQ
ncbi:hypothetical protein SteCoe_31585 [Stentor coeruleus]|uniref:Protein kinase domain-containing protein n=1 Tax=Stentor coeruleus TaxID=5963 RepID=A0A1R2B104_9CILI|nr:hypothetical protein SteCoe_31585 [Stentor coeruleus]